MGIIEEEAQPKTANDAIDTIAIVTKALVIFGSKPIIAFLQYNNRADGQNRAI